MVPTGTGYAMRAAVIRKRATHIISNYGVNDIYNATNGASMQVILSWMNKLRDMFPTQWFYQVTIPGETIAGEPTTPSTVGGGLKMLNQVNNYLLSGFAYNDGTFDIASVVQNPRSAGIWTSSTYVSADGIHESPQGYQAIAASNVISVQ
jgi:lysophospholipase L1-like esterase